MRHVTEAYDLLVDKLKEELKKSNSENDDQAHKDCAVWALLTKQLVKHSGKEVALEVGRLIDKEFKCGFEEWVDMEFKGEKK